MKILYNTAEIRNTITKILSISKGRRVVVSAFIGAGSEVYLPKPKGITLICWPQPGSTNPNTIRELMKRGVNVYFAKQMHIKLYWTSDKGSVITSANLSSNALGSGGQIELGAYLQAGQINIDKVLSNIDAKPVTEGSLNRLNDAHHEFIKHNPTGQIKWTKSRNYKNWMNSKPREKWKIEVWDAADIKLSTNAKNLLLNEHGSLKCQQWMSINRGEIDENEWILCLRKTTKRLGNANWMFAHHVVIVPVNERKRRNEGFPLQVIQISALKQYEKPPFSLSGRKIQKSIRSAYKDIEQKDGIPSNKFINRILYYYE